MQSWTIANQKGGVGKTTMVVTLAGWLAKADRPALLLDLDPQASLSGYFGIDAEGVEASLYDLFRPDGAPPIEQVTVPTAVQGIDLVPASPAMATLDRQLGSRHGQGLVLSRAIRQVADRYDVVMLDCPPTLGVLMINALAACDGVLIPTQTEHLALQGLERMMRTLAMVGRSLGLDVDHLVVPTMFDRRTRASIQALRQLRRDFPRSLWGDVVPVDTRFREASTRGVPLPQLAPGSRGARAFGELLEHLLENGFAPAGAQALSA